MPFGSFNKKLQQSFDQRTAGSDNAQVASLGGRIFNVGGQGNPTAAVQEVTQPSLWLIAALAAVVIFTIYTIFNRR